MEIRVYGMKQEDCLSNDVKTPFWKKGVGEKRRVFPVEETTEGAKRPKGQKPTVSEERERVHLVERARGMVVLVEGKTRRFESVERSQKIICRVTYK